MDHRRRPFARRARLASSAAAFGAALLVLLAVAAPAPATSRGEAAALVSGRDHATIDPGLRAAIDEAVRAEMAEQDAVGVAIGVIRDGRVVMTAGYGLADREAGVPVTDRTLFRWASISKPLTALAAGHLVQAGRLDLDADVRTYVPEFPEQDHVITTRQLLAHLGGIVHYSNGPVVPAWSDPPGDPTRSVIAALDRFRGSPLVAEPGTTYAYSTHGYVLASAVVERAAGMPYDVFVRDAIARPLGMHALQPDHGWAEIAGRTKGYRRRGDRIVRSIGLDVSWKLGGGRWTSDVHALAHFAAGLLDSDVVDEPLRELLWTEQRTSAGEPTGYGLGFSVDRPNGVLRVAHGGAQPMTRTRMVLYPDERHGVVVMTNSEYGVPGRFSTAVYRAISAWRNAGGG